jgi:hypothetical protein
MRTPPEYEEMIREIAKTAGKYGFFYREDTLKDVFPQVSGSGHCFDAYIYLQRAGDYHEDDPILVQV